MTRSHCFFIESLFWAVKVEIFKLLLMKKKGMIFMAFGYGSGNKQGSKYRGGEKNREKVNDGPGKNAQHNKGEHHSQKAKGNPSPRGGGR